MRNLRLPLLSLAICATFESIDAAEAQTYERCQEQSGGVTVRLRACDAVELRARNAVLNQTYTMLMRALPPARRDSLRAAERAWIGFRDAECAFRTTAEAGGSAAPLVTSACHLELTAARIQELRRALRMEQR